MKAIYNEIDRFCCDWLQNLMDAGAITPGRIDDCSIVDLSPDDLTGYSRVHLFAGVGGWDHALALAGWPDDRPVWTGSCPCQPFSAAGKGKGFDDPRHLWPKWFPLIREHRPPTIFGEQVEGPAGRAWLDLVFTDLEGIGYAVGAVVFPAAGVGAPHLRHRLYWVAYADGLQPQQPARQGPRSDEAQGRRARDQFAGRGDASGLADAECERAQRRVTAEEGPADARSRADGQLLLATGTNGRTGRPSPPDSFWSGADWIFCRDDKWRPIEPRFQQMVDGIPAGLGLVRAYPDKAKEITDAAKASGIGDEALRAMREGSGATEIWRSALAAIESFPLAHGVEGRTGKLRAYGNAICVPQAVAFIQAALESIELVTIFWYESWPTFQLEHGDETKWIDFPSSYSQEP